MTDVAKLTAQLELQSAQFERAMAGANKSMGRMQAETKKTNQQLKVMNATAGRVAGGLKVALGGLVGMLGARGIGAAISRMREVQDELDEVGKAANNIGVPVEKLQELRFAADLAGVGTTELNAAVKTLSKAINEADQGVATYLDNFEALGITARDNAGDLKTVDTVILEAADAFAGMESATEKAAIAQELFGKAGIKMVGFLSQGREQIEAYMQAAQDLGLVMSQDMTDAAQQFNDRMSVMSQVIDAQVTRSLVQLAPVIEGVMKWVVNLTVSFQVFAADVGKAMQWVREKFDDTSLAIVGIMLAFKALQLVLAVNPFIAIATAAVVAVVLIVSKWELIKILFTYGIPKWLDDLEVRWAVLGVRLIILTGNLAIKMNEIWDGIVNYIIDKINSLNVALGESFAWLGNVMANLPGMDVLGAKLEEIGTKLQVPIEKSDAAGEAAERMSERISSGMAGLSNAMEKSAESTRVYNEALGGLEDTGQKAIDATAALKKTMDELGGGGGSGDGEGGGATGKAAKGVDKVTKSVETLNDKLLQTGANGITSFTDGLIDGQLKFKEFTYNILKDMAKMIVRAIVLNSLMSAFGMGSGGKPNIVGNALIKAGAADPTKFAKGGVVNAPTLFSAGGGAGLMGEAGPEGILPLKRTSSGDLGVQAAMPQITINNYSGQEVTVDRTEAIIKIAVGQARQAVQNDFASSMNTGQGTYARSMEGGYNARRKAV